MRLGSGVSLQDPGVLPASGAGDLPKGNAGGTSTLPESSTLPECTVSGFGGAADVSEPCRIVRETLWLKPEEEGAGIERERPRFPSPPGRPMDGWWPCCNRKRGVRSVGSVGS